MEEKVNGNNILKHKVILLFLPIAVLAVIIFAFISFFILKDFILGWEQVATLITLVAVIPLCLKTKRVVLAGNVLAVLGLLIIMPWLITGGFANTGFSWSSVYVVGAFFVTSKRWTIFWLSFFLIIAIVIVWLSELGYFEIAYSIPALLNLLVIYIFTFGFVYQFNKVAEYYLLLYNKNVEELKRKNEELISVNKEVEHYAYRVSHELKEPLRTISNFAKLLEKKLLINEDEDIRASVKFITEATLKMQDLIKYLLNFSRVGATPVLETVDCNGVLETVKNNLNAAIQESQAEIMYPNLPILKANKMELKQLFQNLLSNAIKFGKKNVKPEIKIDVEETETDYLFSVKDNGIGVDERFKNKIFTIFERLHTDTEFPGTGIGLAICKKIVELHNGRIWMESKLGGGCSFYFTISKNI